MADIIDLPLLAEARKRLEELVDARGIRWFLAPEGKRLLELEKSKIDLVVSAAANVQVQGGRPLSEEAVELCRVQVRRELIRKVALAMLATGC